MTRCCSTVSAVLPFIQRSAEVEEIFSLCRPLTCDESESTTTRPLTRGEGAANGGGTRLCTFVADGDTSCLSLRHTSSFPCLRRGTPV
ncbi:hypothetical protein BGY98DRAFT_1021723, partial [Russula aff. rugulosa BPL654]